MTKCQCELMVYRQNLRAQTAITEIHFIHPDIVFDLSASFSCADDVFSHVKLCRVLIFMGVCNPVIVSLELKTMCSEIWTLIVWLRGSQI